MELFVACQRRLDKRSDGFAVFVFQLKKLDAHMGSRLDMDNHAWTLDVALVRGSRKVEAGYGLGLGVERIVGEHQQPALADVFPSPNTEVSGVFNLYLD